MQRDTIACSEKWARPPQTALEHNRKGNGASGLVLPKIVADRHIFNQYVIRAARRDQLKAALQESGVSTEIYYPVPLHLQECFAYLGHKAGAFPESESAAKETLALPIYPELSEPQARHVVRCIEEFLHRGDCRSPK